MVPCASIGWSADLVTGSRDQASGHLLGPALRVAATSGVSRARIGPGTYRCKDLHPLVGLGGGWYGHGSEFIPYLIMEKKIFSSSSPPSGEQQMKSNFTKFFFIKLQNGSFSSVSPFLIHKTIQSVLGEIELTRKLRSGDLLIKVFNAKQSTILTNCTSFGTFQVSVIPHPFLNFSKGIISESELYNVSESEILENLKDQDVTKVRRITIRRDGQQTPTKHLILTFNKPEIPSHIKAGYLRCPVRHYIPNPLRCFKCQRFGHGKASCRGTEHCARCSQPGHESENCAAEPKCLNCKGSHPAYSRSCPKWNSEKEIQSVRIKNKLSYIDARRTVEAQTPTVGISYASATKTKKYVTIGTQTEPPTSAPQKTTNNSITKSVQAKTSTQTLPTTQTDNSPYLVKSPFDHRNPNRPQHVKPNPNRPLHLKLNNNTKKSKNSSRPLDPRVNPGLSKKYKKTSIKHKDPNKIRERVEDELSLFPSDISDDESFMDIPPPLDPHLPKT